MACDTFLSPPVPLSDGSLVGDESECGMTGPGPARLVESLSIVVE